MCPTRVSFGTSCLGIIASIWLGKGVVNLWKFCLLIILRLKIVEKAFEMKLMNSGQPWDGVIAEFATLQTLTFIPCHAHPPFTPSCFEDIKRRQNLFFSPVHIQVKHSCSCRRSPGLWQRFGCPCLWSAQWSVFHWLGVGTGVEMETGAVPPFLGYPRVWSSACCDLCSWTLPRLWACPPAAGSLSLELNVGFC